MADETQPFQQQGADKLAQGLANAAAAMKNDAAAAQAAAAAGKASVDDMRQELAGARSALDELARLSSEATSLRQALTAKQRQVFDTIRAAGAAGTRQHAGAPQTIASLVKRGLIEPFAGGAYGATAAGQRLDISRTTAELTAAVKRVKQLEQQIANAGAVVPPPAGANKGWGVNKGHWTPPQPQPQPRYATPRGPASWTPYPLRPPALRAEAERYRQEMEAQRAAGGWPLPQRVTARGNQTAALLDDRRLVQRALESLPEQLRRDIPVTLGRFQGYNGAYARGTDQVEIATNRQQTNLQDTRALLAHELWHAATVRALYGSTGAEVRAIAERMQEMAKRLRREITQMGPQGNNGAWTKGQTGIVNFGEQVGWYFNQAQGQNYGREPVVANEGGARLMQYRFDQPEHFRSAVGQENFEWFESLWRRMQASLPPQLPGHGLPQQTGGQPVPVKIVAAAGGGGAPPAGTPPPTAQAPGEPEPFRKLRADQVQPGMMVGRTRPDARLVTAVEQLAQSTRISFSTGPTMRPRHDIELWARAATEAERGNTQAVNANTAAQNANTAAQTAPPAPTPKGDETPKIGNTAQFEQLLGPYLAQAQGNAAGINAFNQAVAAGQIPAPGTPAFQQLINQVEQRATLGGPGLGGPGRPLLGPGGPLGGELVRFQAQGRALAEFIEVLRGEVVNPGTAIVPRRDERGFIEGTAVEEPRGYSETVTAEMRARTRLANALRRRSASEDELATINRQYQNARRRGDSEERERLRVEREAAQARVRAANAEVTAARREDEERRRAWANRPTAQARERINLQGGGRRGTYDFRNRFRQRAGTALEGPYETVEGTFYEEPRAQAGGGGGFNFTPPPGGGGGGAPPPPGGGRGGFVPPEPEGFGTGRRAMQDFESELQRLTRIYSASMDTMRRHGLLTTEFLDAMREGRTTVRELGTQVGGTIAKFAGWTTAASLTYGVASAVQTVGQGALASAEGVTSLQRVVDNLDTRQAREQFRSLSTQFNLPIEQVTGTAYEAAKAFQDADSRRQAIEASLYGVKIGELDPATSGRYTAAIQRGFGLQADRLMDVVDEANALQNRFGASFRDIVQGTAGAAGTFSAAGGTPEELLTFVGLGTLVTGRSGQEIGTAMRRTAEIIQRPERRMRIIDLLGVDPQDTSVTDVFRAAAQRLREGGDINEIASAITTPELASGRVIPILQNMARFERMLRGAQAGPRQHSAARELEIALSGPTEQIAKLNVGLQNLGASLEQSGIFSGLALMLSQLNNLLTVATWISDRFADLPAGMGQAIGLAATFGGLGAVTRRFVPRTMFRNEEGLLARSFGRNPASQRRADILQTLDDERRNFIIPEQQRVGRNVVRQQYAVGQQAGRLRAMEDARDEMVAAGASAEQIERHDRAYALQLARHEGLTARLADSEAELADLAQRQRDAQERERRLRRGSTRRALGRRYTPEDIDELAYRERVLWRGNTEPRPNAMEPEAVQGGGGTGAGGGAAANAAAGAAGARAGARRAAEETEETTRRTGETARQLAEGERTVTQRASRFGRLGTTIGRFGGGIGRLGGALLAAIGPLDAVMIAGFALFGAIKMFSDNAAKDAQRIRAYGRIANVEDINAARRAFEEASHEGFTERAGDAFVNFARDAVNWARRHGVGGQPGVGQVPNQGGQIGQTANEREEAERERLRQWLNEVPSLNAQDRALTLGQIRRRFRANLQQGVDPQDALRQAIEESFSSRGIMSADFLHHPAQYRAAVRRARQFRKWAREATDAAGAITDLFNAAFLTASQMAEAIPGRIFTGAFQAHRGHDIRQVSRELGPLRRQLAVTNDPQEQASIIERIQALQAPIEEELQRRLEIDLARTPRVGARGALRRDYIDRLRQLRTAPIQRQVNQADRQAGRLQDELREERRDRPPGALADRPGAGLQAWYRAHQERIKELRQRIRANRGRRRRLEQQLEREQLELEALEQEQIAAQAQERLRHQESITRFNVANAQGPEAEYQAQLAGLQRQRDTIAALQGQGFDEDDLRDANSAILELRKDHARQIQQDAADLINANAELARSRTDDPVVQAAIDARAAQQILAAGGFERPADRIRAQAEVNRTRMAQEEALRNRRLENIEYRHDIGRLTDEAYLDALRAELRGMDRRSEAYRQLRMRIGRLAHDMEQESNFENLDVGNIRLPTVYDVRRATRQGTDTMPATRAHVSQTNNYTINVRNQSDAETVAHTIGRLHRTQNRAALRSAGLR